VASAINNADSSYHIISMYETTTRMKTLHNPYIVILETSSPLWFSLFKSRL